MILMLHPGRWLVLPACWLRAVNLHRTSFQGACAPYARQAKRANEIIGAMRRALGGRPGQRLMTTCTRQPVIHVLWKGVESSPCSGHSSAHLLSVPEEATGRMLVHLDCTAS